jgi:hypothetical protein
MMIWVNDRHSSKNTNLFDQVKKIKYFQFSIVASVCQEVMGKGEI